MIYHKSVLADLLTPVSAFLRVGRDADRAFLLESVDGGEKIARYSFLGVGPYRSFEGNFHDFRSGFPEKRVQEPGLPPFTGGAVGIFGYDLVREFEKLPNRHAGKPFQPSVLMDFYDTVMAFDHLKRQIVIMSHSGMDRVEELEARLRQDHAESLTTNPKNNHVRSMVLPSSNFSQPDFEQAVESAREYIRAGDIFQVVLSQRFQTGLEGDPFNIYRALRYVNPSPYMFFLKRGDLCVTGASPEMLLRVQGRTLEYRPIAGTRRRGRNPEEEKQFQQELMTDEKERAEHLMLVDLGRNDLGRVSEYGSVRVVDLMFLEQYSHVMHLVSSLNGKLRPELDSFDAFKACFPAGTVTGAPKVRAMEIIEELEPCRRKIYAGAVGYLDFSGNLDTCITIRTLVISKGKVYAQAGAGIVADSVPSLEYKECHNKARALFQALDLSRRIH